MQSGRVTLPRFDGQHCTDKMVLLHGFVKKSQKTPVADLKMAKQRLSDLKER